MGDKMLTDSIGRNRRSGLLFRRMIESGEKPKQLVMITDTMVMRRGIDPQRASDVGAILIKRLFKLVGWIMEDWPIRKLNLQLRCHEVLKP